MAFSFAHVYCMTFCAVDNGFIANKWLNSTTFGVCFGLDTATCSLKNNLFQIAIIFSHIKWQINGKSIHRYHLIDFNKLDI